MITNHVNIRTLKLVIHLNKRVSYFRNLAK